MTDIGGVRVHLNCMGTGPITVVILGTGYHLIGASYSPR